MALSSTPNPHTFDSLLAALRPDLVSRARRYVDRDTAEDVAVDACVTAWTRRESFVPAAGMTYAESFGAWLGGILRKHICHEIWRRGRNREIPNDPAELPDSAGCKGDLMPVLEMEARRLIATSERLTTKQRRSVTARLDGDTVEEIAAREGISHQMVSKHVGAALSVVSREADDSAVAALYLSAATFCFLSRVNRYYRPTRMGAKLAREKLQRMK